MAGKLAVVLSGGGAKGAFQVGVLDELITVMGVKFDIWAGVSTGAIQALGGAMDDIPGLVKHWTSIKSNKDIYTDNAGILGGLLGADSLHDTKPLRQRLSGFADEAKIKASGKKLLLGVVNLQTGKFENITENGKSPSGLKLPIADWVYASCAMPIFFKPLKTKDAQGIEDQWVDGGVRDVTPLKSAMEQGPDGILIIRASAPPKDKRNDKLFKSLIKVGLRATGIQQSEVSANDIANAKLINDLLSARDKQLKALQQGGASQALIDATMKPINKTLADYRIVPVELIEPVEDFADTLEFSPAAIRDSIEAGRKAARDAAPRLKSFLGL